MEEEVPCHFENLDILEWFIFFPDQKTMLLLS